MITRGKDTILPVIGLEIHVQLATATKLFCRCANHFGDLPNSNVCPVCLGLPGALPVLNKQAVDLSIKVGFALHCEVADLTKWDRKSYYYPDLPKNYQISQYDLPINAHGHLDVPKEDGTIKKIRILRAHLEEDAGKNIHDNPKHTGVDLNRAGIPLLEIVSEPDMNDAEEVLYYARYMQRLVRWVGASEANMERGNMRFEPNINLHITRGGITYKTPIVEVKNLNSFKSLEDTIHYEIDRQYDEWYKDPEGYSLKKLGKQNRGYDVSSGRTVFQREKEEAHDYRYFPEPDLVPVTINEQWKQAIKGTIGELPLERELRYRTDYKLADKEVTMLTAERALGDLLDEAIKTGGQPKRCVNLLVGKAASLANQKNCSITELGIQTKDLAQLSSMIEEGKINSTTAANIFDKMLELHKSPLTIAEGENLLIKTDIKAIEKWVEEALAANPQAIEDVAGDEKKRKKAFNFLTGQVMQRSKGTASPPEVQKILKEKLKINDI